MRWNFAVCFTVVMLMGAFSICSDVRTAQGQTSPAAVSSAKLTNEDIMGLVKAGISPDIIVAKIQTSACRFDTSPLALKELKAAGVQDDVILAMIKNSGKTVPKGKPVNPSQTTTAAKASNRGATHATTPEAPAPGGRNLWIARFTGQPKALAAIASVQQSDLAALEQSGLFKKVSSFASHSKQPAGSWSLSAKEISYYSGNTAKRMLVGFGTGRAHIVMDYKLRSPDGSVVWTKKIKTEPPLWSSAGTLGGLQNQSSATSKQAQELVGALSKLPAFQN